MNSLRRGVTLVEMLVVVSIIGLMAAVSFPSVTSGLDSIRLQSAADSVASFVNAAANRAERRQEVTELVIDPKANRLALYSTEPSFPPHPPHAAKHRARRGFRTPHSTAARWCAAAFQHRSRKYQRRAQARHHGPDQRHVAHLHPGRAAVTAARPSAGFTLLEVLIATLIMALAVVGLLSALTTSMRNAAKLTDHDRMALLARTKMDEVLVDYNLPLEAEFDGAFDPAITGGEPAGYHVALGVFEAPPQAGPGSALLQRVTLHVWWKSRGSAALHGSGSVSPQHHPAAGAGAALKPAALARQAGFTLIEILIAVSLVGLLSVAMLFSIRVALNAQLKADTKLTDNRRVMGAQRALEQELNNFMPETAIFTPPEGGSQPVPFFQGQPQTMRFVSSYSLNQASRGLPQILEFLVVEGDRGGVRLIVNELPYRDAYSTGARISAIAADPEIGVPLPVFLPIETGAWSFVIADRLAYCRLMYLEYVKETRRQEWRADWIQRQWPLAVRIEMAPLETSGARLHPVTVTAALHADRSQELTYSDQFNKP